MGEYLGRVGVKRDFDKWGVRIGGTEVEVGQVDRSEMGILRYNGVEEAGS
jgi:hypothetical protein